MTLKHESPHTGEKTYRCKHNEPVCIHSIHHQRNEIIQSVTNLTHATYVGMSSFIPITKKYMQGITLAQNKKYIHTKKYMQDTTLEQNNERKPSLTLLSFSNMKELYSLTHESAQFI
jgi:hypothetical protein